ncbi:unnamed protein product, partial [Coregonus sp. 'balchen']
MKYKHTLGAEFLSRLGPEKDLPLAEAAFHYPPPSREAGPRRGTLSRTTMKTVRIALLILLLTLLQLLTTDTRHKCSSSHYICPYNNCCCHHCCDHTQKRGSEPGHNNCYHQSPTPRYDHSSAYIKPSLTRKRGSEPGHNNCYHQSPTPRYDHSSAYTKPSLTSASFQSRPDSTKDGVMLLGVKSSG